MEATVQERKNKQFLTYKKENTRLHSKKLEKIKRFRIGRNLLVILKKFEIGDNIIITKSYLRQIFQLAP